MSRQGDQRGLVDLALERDQRERLSSFQDGKSRSIRVCAECLRASCWHGTFLCDKARGADTTTRTERELDELALEHPSHYAAARVRLVEGA
jgi:hypothetical protein